ncbi:hypothetical protein ALQ78_101392 [Pseudomonas syringae pv. aptata]|nr:putative uncharacterized protein PHA60 [Pseudomonas syringae pv. syringae]KPY35515.1 hypothetical protein ALO65_101897 [Pseudomonas syringae pv. papulans]RMM38960.1 hypothetical protein ALQ78_101392 [Pseudomonas syringae pv. aptata]RMS61197.1 hypothetical protein ALP62_102229 [Pseudomonas syringae pv. aceris]RMN40892.1 hypothetical protein ALQ60_101773 [Pseudomonas syringae pv. papulans]
MKPAAGRKPTAIAPTVMSAYVSLFWRFQWRKRWSMHRSLPERNDADQSTIKE